MLSTQTVSYLYTGNMALTNRTVMHQQQSARNLSWWVTGEICHCLLPAKYLQMYSSLRNNYASYVFAHRHIFLNNMGKINFWMKKREVQINHAYFQLALNVLFPFYLLIVFYVVAETTLWEKQQYSHEESPWCFLNTILLRVVSFSVEERKLQWAHHSQKTLIIMMTV